VTLQAIYSIRKVFKLFLFCSEVTYQTRVTKFHQDIQTPRRKLKYATQRNIFDERQGNWIAYETLSPVFDISSQSKQNLRSKPRSKIVKIYPNLLHGCDFLCFNLIKYY